MASWDWTTVGMIIFGVGIGVALGGWWVVDRLESALLRVASHRNVAKLASAADKIGDKFAGDGGGWPGLIAGGLNFLTGGRFGAAQQAAAGGIQQAPSRGSIAVFDEDGNQIGWASRR